MESNHSDMRKPTTFLWLASLLVFMFVTACEKEVEDPEACYTLTIKKEGEVIELADPYTVDAGRAIQFTNCGHADFYAYFAGTPGHIWSDFTGQDDLSTTGSDTNSTGDFSITYSNTGTYTATVVLTNRQVGDSYNYKQVAVDFVITVTEAEE